MHKPFSWRVALGCLALSLAAIGSAAEAAGTPTDAVSNSKNVADTTGNHTVDPVVHAAAQPTSTAPASGHPLRVAIAPVAPFVLPQTAAPEGFSIDLWNELARRMRVDFTWSKVPAQPNLLPAVQHGDADVAIAAITMTPERENVVDFSIPYFDSGL